MRTFQGSASLSFKIVVPDSFLVSLREQAQAEDATPFLKAAQAQHPTNEDEFLAMILSNGTRIGVREQMVAQMTEAGLGGTVSPVKIEVIASVIGHEAPVTAQVINIKSKETA